MRDVGAGDVAGVSKDEVKIANKDYDNQKRAIAQTSTIGAPGGENYCNLSPTLKNHSGAEIFAAVAGPLGW